MNPLTPQQIEELNVVWQRRLQWRATANRLIEEGENLKKKGNEIIANANSTLAESDLNDDSYAEALKSLNEGYNLTEQAIKVLREGYSIWDDTRKIWEQKVIEVCGKYEMGFRPTFTEFDYVFPDGTTFKS